MIRCKCRPEGWHTFPKIGRPNATWTFNGDLEKPTFHPSMNECSNPSTSPDFNPRCSADERCHFVISNGNITYQNDCSHNFKGQTMPLDPWPEDTVKYYAALKLEWGSEKA